MRPQRKEYRKLINSRQWRDARAAAMLRAGFLCEDCRNKGYVSRATEVHHIRPVEWCHDAESAERAMFDMNNLVALCRRCHTERHRELFSHDAKKRKEREQQRNDAAYNRLFGTDDDEGAYFFRPLPP